MKKSRIAIIVVIVVIAILAAASLYTVRETEQVVITQFGRIVKNEAITVAGLHVKVPFIQKVNYFPKNLQTWDGDQGQTPTLDKTFIWVDTFALWKVTDAVKFFQTVNNTDFALTKLNDIIDPSVRNFITSNRLIEAVRMTNRTLDTYEEGMAMEDNDLVDVNNSYVILVGREAIAKNILLQAQPKLAEFGIELVDVKIKRINYVDEVRNSVYKRMIAERKQIAEKFRSEGMGEAQKILGEKERELQKISSEAYRTAQEVKGQADAEAARIYAEAYNVDPDFYAFVETMKIYQTVLGKDASLVLSTDSELLKYLKGHDE